MGRSLPCARRRLITSTPSRSGMVTSRRMSAGWSRAISSSASRPPAAVRMAKPSRRRARSRASRIAASSSTTSTAGSVMGAPLHRGSATARRAEATGTARAAHRRSAAGGSAMPERGLAVAAAVEALQNLVSLLAGQVAVLDGLVQVLLHHVAERSVDLVLAHPELVGEIGLELLPASRHLLTVLPDLCGRRLVEAACAPHPGRRAALVIRGLLGRRLRAVASREGERASRESGDADQDEDAAYAELAKPPLHRAPPGGFMRQAWGSSM